MIFESRETSNGKVRENIIISAHRNKSGRLTYIIKDEESLIVASVEIEGGHGPLLDNHYISDQLQHVVKTSKGQCGDNDINKMSSLKYCCEAIKHVDERESEHKIQTRESHTGLLKVSILVNTYTNQSDPRLACIMFHKIYTNVQEPETPRYSTIISRNPKPKVTRILFTTPAISTVRTEPTRQPMRSAARPTRNPNFPITSMEL